MQEGTTPEIKAQPTETAEAGKNKTVEALQKLQEQVLDKQLKEAVGALLSAAMKNNGELPQANIDAFNTSLTQPQREELARFMSGEDALSRLGLLKAETPKSQEAAAEAPKGTNAEKIIGMIGGVVDKMGIGPKLNEAAQKFGFKAEFGDQSSFVKNMLTGLVAKAFESLAFAFKSFNPNVEKMLTVSIDLRIHQLGLGVKDGETYRKAYLKRANEASSAATFTPPENLKDAVAILTPKKTETVVAKADEKKPDEKAPAAEATTGDSAKKTSERTA